MPFADFMIIGAQKCGTTTLAEILASHPDICFSQEKEPHFFSKSLNWERDIEDYKKLFAPKRTQICGEASTSYTCYPEFNKNIWHLLYKFNPKLKLIYIMRDPVNRIVSHYMHNYLRGYTSEKSLEKAVLNEPAYINRTRYFVQVKPYLDTFGQDQVLLLTLEEFAKNEEITLNRIAYFLNIRPEFNDANTHKNKSIGKTRRNTKIDSLAKSKAITSLKPLVPNALRKTISSNLHRLTAIEIQVRPTASNELSEAILSLLRLDVLEIEKLMGRILVEWNFPTDR